MSKETAKELIENLTAEGFGCRLEKCWNGWGIVVVGGSESEICRHLPDGMFIEECEEGWFVW